MQDIKKPACALLASHFPPSTNFYVKVYDNRIGENVRTVEYWSRLCHAKFFGRIRWCASMMDLGSESNKFNRFLVSRLMPDIPLAMNDLRSLAKAAHFLQL